MPRSQQGKRSIFREHSLTFVTAGILILWIVLYSVSNDHTHIGAFFGNAIADWTGLVVMILATKRFYEKGSAESRRPPHPLLRPIPEAIRDHSLTLFLVITGIGWVLLYSRMNPDAKWGNVVGNLVSEWTQILGIVLLTKKLSERHSHESRR